MNRYPWRLLPHLASNVEHYRRREADDALTKLLYITWRQSEADLSLWKLRCSQIASACMRGALRGGASSDLSMDEHLHFLQRLSHLTDRAKIHRLMRSYVNALLRRVRPFRSTCIERVVVAVKKKLREDLDVARSLAEFAHQFGVSQGHLSRSFAAIVGQPYRIERRRVRMEAACRMLSRSQLKVSAIARQLGIADPSQFVADFRREYGITPGKYRRRHYKV